MFSQSNLSYFKFLSELEGLGKLEGLGISSLILRLKLDFPMDDAKATAVATEWKENKGEIVDFLNEHEADELDTESEGEDENDKTESEQDDEEDMMETETTTSESSTKSSGEEVSNVWSDSKTYDVGTRVAHKKRVYEAKRKTNGHPTSRFDWKVLPREVAYVKKTERKTEPKLNKTKATKTSIVKKAPKNTGRVDRMMEAISKLEMIVERLAAA